MTSIISFPSRQEDRCIETALVRRTIRQTMDAHPDGGLIVWTGPSRIGKTTTAKEMVKAIEEADTPEDQNAFAPFYYEVSGNANGNRPASAIGGIRSLHFAAIGPIHRRFRNSPTEDMARRVTQALAERRIEMVFIDEAGTLDIEEIRGLTVVLNEARSIDHRLSIVLIGMDELPATIQKLPQVKNRVVHWCYFEPYSKEEIGDLLYALSDSMKRLDKESPEFAQITDIVFTKYAGIVGTMKPFIRFLDQRLGPRVPCHEAVQSAIDYLDEPQQRALRNMNNWNAT
jgi:type II secretory pathway predicted ATPase ExeA